MGIRAFPHQVGPLASPDAVRGYYLDFSAKAPVEPMTAEALRAVPLIVVSCQQALGAYDRYLRGDGERWLAAALVIGRYLVATQERSGLLAGAWRHDAPRAHTHRVPAGWISGMAQGEAASLLVRLYQTSGDDAFAESAVRALGPLSVSVTDGGVCRELGGGPFPEEYPTDPASFVLNGAIFAAWGCRDVALALNDPSAQAAFDRFVDTLAANLNAWDLGYWSRYDLYPYRRVNIAAPWYHRLHVLQLGILADMTRNETFATTRDRWRRYQASLPARGRALVQKTLFRMVVPAR